MARLQTKVVQRRRSGRRSTITVIGLKRGTVKLLPHNPKWARLFAKEKKLLKNMFGDTIIAIEHIGSTAIPGIPAKPIVDMNVGVQSLEIARSMKEKFVKLGYEHRPFVPGHTKEDLKEQELYVKGPEANRTHHAHVTVYGNEFWTSDLLFRDYLRLNHFRAEKYTILKKKLAKQYADDRAAYTKGKRKFIIETLEIAKEALKRKEFLPNTSDRRRMK